MSWICGPRASTNTHKGISMREKLDGEGMKLPCVADETGVVFSLFDVNKEFDLRNRSEKDEDASSSKTFRIQGRYENWRSYSKKDQAFGDARVGIGCYWNRWFQ
ncbi:hypothetical protein H5410_063942 [Solanum commersonii]|uniref:Uncharacterized protein n=1 Tax=Solanum commersonii TaxID=4109 RepID=A0A9J5WGU3_SOLCO|nr:hypothetical protein H5410_063942 [Solanum commersonii]